MEERRKNVSAFFFFFNPTNSFSGNPQGCSTAKGWKGGNIDIKDCFKEDRPRPDSDPGGDQILFRT